MSSPGAHEAMQGSSGGCNLMAAGKRARDVIEGVRHRQVRIGERTDGHRKAWITPEIVRGGFSTGMHLAGGSSKPHEAALISEHGIIPAGRLTVPVGFFSRRKLRGSNRRAINEWCLTSSAGRKWLLHLSRTGLYRLPTAEEGCLLAIVVLEDAGIVADHIIEEISPWFDQLRFFPEPTSTPAADGSVSSMQSVEELLEKSTAQLRRFEDKLVSSHSRRSAVETVYLPTYNAVVEEARRVCGWLSDDAIAAEGDDVAPTSRVCTATTRANLILFGFEKKLRRSSLWKLLDALEVVSLHGRQTRQGFVTHIQRHVDEASVSLSRRCSIPRAAMLSARRQAFFFQLRGLVDELKLNECPSYGLSMDRVAHLSSRFPLFRTEIGRVALGTLGELAAAGVLGSSEKLATQAVGVAVKHRATHFATEPARTLALHLLTAFMARRSKLLLNLSTQVRVSEVPWFAALADAFDLQQQQPQKRASGDAKKQAATDDAGPPSLPIAANPVAREVFRVHLSSFAGLQVPNRLVRLLGEYLGCTGLVKEIAADIFEGAFRGTFGAQAKQREEMLGPGTPYGDYYQAVLVKFPDDAASRIVRVDELGLGPGSPRVRRNVVENGIAIERVAVSTTHNLLHLLVALELNKDAALLEAAAGVALARLVKGLRSRSTQYVFLRDESRRSAAACRAYLVFVSLLKKKEHAATNNDNTEAEIGGREGLLTSLLERLKEDAAAAARDLPEERAAVLRDLAFAVEGLGDRPARRNPLMGWSKSNERHPVFFGA